MPKISGYQITEEVYTSKKTIVYRAIRQVDHQPVILKYLNREFPTQKEIAKLHHEYEILANLQIEGVVKALALEKVNNSVMIVMQEKHAISLKQLMNQNHKKSNTDVKVCLEYFIQFCEILVEVHKKGIVHRDIKPDNIVIEPTTGKVYLINFGKAVNSFEDALALEDGMSFGGSLAYISPEQTGRMNRGEDYRTDLYSAGVTFYELFSHHLPFEAEDSMGWVHCHIAKIPPLATQKNPDVPNAVSQIIHRLLAKNAEDRYQTVYGLKKDLEKCLDQWNASNCILPFALGEFDKRTEFKISQKLYGRDRDIDVLAGIYKKVSFGAKEMVVICGPSGIGKSSLASELNKTIVERNGSFNFGKFDQYKQNEPLHGLIESFRSWCNQLLLLTSHELEQWKARLLAAVGANGQLVIDLLPELEMIIGPQQSLQVLDPVEGENRFNYTFLNFIKATAKKENPLVLYLDDIQWADSASLKMLDVLLRSHEVENLMVLATWRSEEDDNLFTQFLKEYKKDNHVYHMYLTPLDESNIEDILKDAMQENEVNLSSLSHLILKKTGGSPFFVKEFISQIFNQGLIKFEFEDQMWKINLEEIQKQEVTVNVVELMLKKVLSLSHSTQLVIRIAAAIGPRFSVRLVGKLSSLPLNYVAKELWTCIHEGLVQTQGHDLKRIKDMDSEALSEISISDKVDAECFFIHDRIQQAALRLIDQVLLKSYHIEIGRYLKSELSKEELDAQLYFVLFHFNHGRSLIESDTEKQFLSELNMFACRRAKKSTSYALAMEFVNIAIEILPQDTWQKHYDLALALYQEAVEIAYLLRLPSELEKYANVILKNAKHLLDTIPTNDIRIVQYISSGKIMEATKLGLLVLKDLGMKFSLNPSVLGVAFKLLKVNYWSLRNVDEQKILEQDLMTDPYDLARIKIMNRIMSSAFVLSPNLLPILMLNIIDISLKKGVHPLVPFSYVGMSMVATMVLGDIPRGRWYSNLSLRLIEKLKAPDAEVKTKFTYYYGVFQWDMQVHSTIPYICDCQKLALENGDLEFAGYFEGVKIFHEILCGEPLPKIYRDAKKYSNYLLQIKHELAHSSIKSMIQMLSNLIDESNTSKHVLKGEYLDDDYEMRVAINNGRYTNVFYYVVWVLMSGVLFKRHEHSFLEYEKYKKYVKNGLGTYMYSTFHFYYALTMLGLAKKDQDKKRFYLKEFRVSYKLIKKWAQFQPFNMLNKLYLIQAEYFSVLRKTKIAMVRYQRAISTSLENKFYHEQALANELTGEFYLSLHNATSAKPYLIAAKSIYQQWGATNKVKELEKMYGELVVERVVSSADPTQTKESNSRHSTTATETHFSGFKQFLDLETVLKASQIIAGEIRLESLLNKMLHILIENAGAQRGVLIEKRDERLLIQAEGSSVDKELNVGSYQPIEEYGQCAQTVVQFVIRTRQNVVIHNGVTDQNFSKDKYIVENSCKSILCFAIVNQGKLLGCVYLENNLTAGAFTSDRIEVLKILSSQAAVSMENALLYRNLEEKVNERTAQLQKKTDDIRYILQNMHQGIFTVSDESLQIQNEYSQFLETILETKLIASTPLMKTLFEGSVLSSDVLSQIEAVILCSFGNKLFAWECNEHLLITEFKKAITPQKIKILELSWDPLLNSKGVVEGIMVTVRDVTKLRQLQIEAESQKTELEMLGQILSISSRQFREFLDSCNQYLSESRSLVASSEHFTQDAIETIFRNLHTAKGISRTYGLTQISQKIHQAEQVYELLRRDLSTPFEKAKLLADLDEVFGTVQSYSVLYEKKLKSFSLQRDDTLVVSKEVLSQIRQLSDGNDLDVRGDLRNLLDSIETVTLSQLMESMSQVFKSVAVSVNKAIPHLNTVDQGVRIKNEIVPLLKDILTHVARNSMDHGIEAKDIRLAAGKSEHGNIEVSLGIMDDRVLLKWRDDGMGLDLRRLREKAKEKGLEILDDLSAANLIFSSGVTTAETVSEISGRGVGLDAVKRFIQAKGGDVKISLLSDLNSGRKAFELLIYLPKKYFLINMAATHLAA